jgi:predicted HTH domain antitoxin
MQRANDRSSRNEDTIMPLVIPDEAPREAGLSERDAPLEFACRLFAAEKLTLWSAAKLAGSGRVEFEQELLARGIPSYRPDPRDLAEEFAALDQVGA